jgi:hypothetical protein
MSLDLSRFGIALPAGTGRKRVKSEARQTKKQAHPERDIQRSVIRYLRQVMPEAITGLIPIEQRGISDDPIARMRYGAARKASGVLKGTPDAFTAAPGGRTIWWEFKAAKGRLTEAQTALHERMRRSGHTVAVCRSIEDARLALHQAGLITRETDQTRIIGP